MRKPQYTWFKMPALDKAEYQLGRALCERYRMMTIDGKPDWTELTTVAYRLMYEVLRQGNGQGEAWIERLVREKRDNPEEERVYEV